jgi:pyruvate, water dikinase
VSGVDEVVDRVVECWASLWSPRVVAYRATRRLGDEPAIAVVVKRMIDAHTSGVMFTADPATGDRDHLVIEASYGLGEVVVSGQVEPDTYVLRKDSPRVVHEHIGTKATKIVRGPGGHDQRVDVPAGDQDRRALDDNALMALAHVAGEIERHYGTPQDVEFAIDDQRIWIVQSRPITTLGDTVPADHE